MGVFKGGGGFRGFKPPQIFQIFFMKRGRKKKMKGMRGGGGLIVNIIFGAEIFSSRVQLFSVGIEIFSGGVEIFLAWLRNFRRVEKL